MQSCKSQTFCTLSLSMFRFKEGVQSIPELEVMGSPEMSVVAVQARDPKKLNVYKLNDLMEKVRVLFMWVCVCLCVSSRDVAFQPCVAQASLHVHQNSFDVRSS